MFLIPFILSAGLDMSLPEFLPEADASGNYIVSSYDVSENEFSVEYIPAEDFAEVSLSPSAEVLEAPTSDEIVLDSLSVDGNSDTISLSRKNHASISSSGVTYTITYNSSSNYYIEYALLSAGVTYELDYSGSIYYGSSMDYDSEVFLYSGASITPSSDLYLMQRHKSGDYLIISLSSSSIPDDPSGNDPEPEDPSGNDPGGDTPCGGDFDDTNIVNSLNHLHQSVRALMFIVLIQFLYPLSLSIVRNIVGGDKNV